MTVSRDKLVVVEVKGGLEGDDFVVLDDDQSRQ